LTGLRCPCRVMLLLVRRSRFDGNRAESLRLQASQPANSVKTKFTQIDLGLAGRLTGLHCPCSVMLLLVSRSSYDVTSLAVFKLAPSTPHCSRPLLRHISVTCSNCELTEGESLPALAQTHRLPSPARREPFPSVGLFFQPLNFLVDLTRFWAARVCSGGAINAGRQEKPD